MPSNDIFSYFIDDRSQRNLRDCELRILVQYINRKHKLKVRESGRKESTIDQICKLQYTLTEKTSNTKIKTRKQLKRLSELALKQLIKE